MATARLTWDEVVGVDGYNAYLKGAPEKYLLDFNGVDQYADIGCQTFGAEGALFSVELNFISDNTTPATLFGVNSGNFEYLFRIHINRDDDETSSAGKMCIQLRSHNGVGRRVGFTSAQIINDGERHHFAVTVNEDTITCYLDGLEIATDLTTNSSWNDSLVGATWNTSSQALCIGANGGSTVGDFANAQVSNVRMWTSERTAYEINSNRFKYLDGPQAGLYANYILSAGAGDTIDENVNSQDGTLVGNVSDNMWVLDMDSATGDFDLNFDGIDQYVELGVEGYGSLLDNITAEFEYINAVDNEIVNIVGTVQDSFSMIFAIRFNQDHTESPAANKIYFHIRDSAANQFILATTDAHPEVSDGEKHRISISKDSDRNVVVYIDGVSVPITVGSDETLSSFVDFQYPLLLGANNGRGTPNNHYTGKLKDLRLWTVVRTPTEINDNKDVVLEGDETGLFAYYPAVEGSGNETRDAAGTNHGTLVNNSLNNMWAEDESSVGGEYTKKNDSLITGETYDIVELPDGAYETYVTAFLSSTESVPSNTVEFTIPA